MDTIVPSMASTFQITPKKAQAKPLLKTNNEWDQAVAADQHPVLPVPQSLIRYLHTLSLVLAFFSSTLATE